MDVIDYEQLEETKKQINRDLGFVDILINNAGLMPKLSGIIGGHPKDIQRVMEVNVLAQFWVDIQIKLSNFHKKNSKYFLMCNRR